jgi:hypothetical protein
VLPDETPFPLAVHPRQMDGTLAFDKPDHPRHRIFRRYRDQHVHVVSHQMSLLNPTLLLLRQVPEYLSQVLPQFRVQRLAATFRDEHHVVFALPLRMT